MLRNLAMFLALAVPVTALAGPVVTERPLSGPAGELVTIQFNFASTKPPPGSLDRLGEVVAWARTHKGGTILIDGYASGDYAAAERIALKRAAVIRDKLLDAGVTSERLVISTFTTPHEAVPRVELFVTPQPRDVAVAARKQSTAVVLWGPALFTNKEIARR